MQTSDPPDAALLELGRLIWAAICLEDVVYTICREIKPRHGPWDDQPIGSRIDEALSDLTEYAPNEMREAATAWLREAKGALERRNSILHAVPVKFVSLPGAPSLPEDKTDWLTHFPRDKSRPQVDTAVTASGLAPARERLQRARQEWIPIAVYAMQSHPGDVVPRGGESRFA